MVVFAIPLQFRPAGHSACTVQIWRHWLLPPTRLEQMVPESHPLVLPGVLHTLPTLPPSSSPPPQPRKSPTINSVTIPIRRKPYILFPLSGERLVSTAMLIAQLLT